MLTCPKKPNHSTALHGRTSEGNLCTSGFLLSVVKAQYLAASGMGSLKVKMKNLDISAPPQSGFCIIALLCFEANSQKTSLIQFLWQSSRLKTQSNYFSINLMYFL